MWRETFLSDTVEGPSPQAPRMQIELATMASGFLGNVQEFASDPAISAMSNVPHPYPADGALRWYERVSALMAAGRSDVNAILVGGAFAGVISLNAIDRDAGTAAVDYWVAVPRQGQGVAKQAVQLCVRKAEAAHAIRTLHSSCLLENRASAAVLLYNGFAEIDVRSIASGRFTGRQLRTFTRVSGPSSADSW